MTVNEILAELRELKGWEWGFEDGRKIRGHSATEPGWTCPLGALAQVRLHRKVGAGDFWSMRKALPFDGASMDRILWAADYNDPEAEYGDPELRITQEKWDWEQAGTTAEEHKALRGQLLAAVGLG